MWAIEAILFTVLGIALGDRLLSFIGLAVFTVAALRIVPFDFRAHPRLIEGTNWDLRFVVIEISGLLTILGGGLYWLIPKFIRRGQQSETDIAVGGMLAGAGNLALMLGVLCQWDNRWALILWTLDAALLWGAGFWFNKPTLRWYAAALAIAMVGGRALHDGSSLDGSYQLLANSRFISLALVAALYFAAGGIYRSRFSGQRNLVDQLGCLLDQRLGEFDEAVLDPLMGILANVVLVTAISFEIHSWYVAAVSAGWSPFTDMHMAEMATYSIVFAVYAAVMVATGFALRYPLFRLLGLFAFGPILLKVFFIDLESLRWHPRVLALAVLGMMLMGVSMLYQKFASRMQREAS